MRNEQKEKPGFMIYHRQLNAMRNMEPERFKALMLAFGDYSESGELPAELDGSDQVIFEIYRERLDHDRERYEQRVEAGRRGGRSSGERRRANGMDEPTEANASKRRQTQANASETKQNEPATSTTTAPTTTTAPSTTTTTAPATASSSEGEQFPAEPEIIISSRRKEEEFPPTREMILSYAREKGFEVDAEDFLARCREAGWRDGSGQPVKNWRLWLKGYLVRKRAESVRERTAPDPRVEALERLKRKFIEEERAHE